MQVFTVWLRYAQFVVQRTLGQRTLGRAPYPRHTVDHVLSVLRGETRDAPPEIERQIAMLPALLGEVEIQRQFQHYPRYLEVLPRLVFQYRRGIPLDQIANSLDFLATEYGIQTVMEITARVLAERLNQEPADAAFSLANRR